MVRTAEEYQKFIDLLYYPDKTFTVLRKGTNQYGFGYMIKADESFFERARNVGLRVSPTQGSDQTVQFQASVKL
jgi:hypothetical protein